MQKKGISQKQRASKKQAARPSVQKIEKKPKEDVEKDVASDAGKRTGKTLQPLRGMKDLLPKDGRYWQRFYRSVVSITNAYNFGYMETPVMEEVSLFVRSIGKGTDVVEKEMYIFEDRDGTKVALRPEHTAGLVRAFITHGMHTLPQPVKVWTYGPTFRHERPQAGRYREFHQFDCETFGARDAVVDAELIVVAYNLLRDVGIPTQVHINSLGSKEDRENYVIELVAYLRSKRAYLSELSKQRINKNPLRVLDSKEPEDQPIIEEAPQIIDWLSEGSKQYFMKVLEYLDELDVPYVLRPTLVRGLDYYTDTVFELYPEGEEATSQGALASGGRYDGLVEQLGGQHTPACGFGLGFERVVNILKKRGEDAGESGLVDQSPIYFAQLGEQARQRGLKLVETLRREGIFVYHNLGKPSLKAQLEIANRYNVTHTLILGQKEVQDGTIIVRNMESGIQEIIDQKKLVNEVRKLIA